ncbi:MAG: hypothetical protein GXO00_02880, partial [Candidatus Diapherotrites archaeon]|nr:hypothetical protein [Candidatus Diapherotrites archaeon]
MGFLRDLYARAEDAFYQLLDTLDSHNVPVYKVHDWLDEHGIPPFPAFLALLALIFIGAAAFFLFPSTPAYTLYVSVVGPDGEPVPYAVVEVYLNGELYTTVTTDSTGFATVKPLPEGTVTLKVSAEGYKQRELTLDVFEDSSVEVKLSKPEDELGETYGVLTLYVVDYLGRPLKASVLVLLPDGRTITKSSDTGEMQLSLPIGVPVEMTIDAVGYESVTKTYTLEQAEAVLTVKLSRNGDVLFTDGGEPDAGTLQNALKVSVLLEGQPVSGATVKVLSVSTGSVYTDVTGEDGSVYFPSLPAGDYQIEVKYGDYSTVSSVFFLDSYAEVSVDLGTGAAYLRVQVLDKEGNPIVNGTAVVNGVTVTTDSTGFAYVPLSLVSSTSQYVTGTDTSTDGEIYTLTVRVEYQGKYLNSFYVEVEGPTTASASTTTGTVVLLLPGGVYDVTVRAYGEEKTQTVELFSDKTLTFTLTDPKVRVVFNVPYPGTITIAGNSYEVNDTLEIFLPPGTYTYVYSTPDYADYEGTLDLSTIGDVVVNIPADVLTVKEYLPEGSSPIIKSVRILYGGAEIPAIVSGATLEVVIEFPKLDSATVKIISSSPAVLLGGSQTYTRTFSPPEPSETISVPITVTSEARDIVNDFKIRVEVDGVARDFSFPLAPFTPKKVGNMFYAGVPINNTIEAPNGKVYLPLAFMGSGEVLIKYNNSEVRVPVSGYGSYIVQFETNLPTKIVLEFYEGGILTGTEVIRVIPVEVIEPPLVPTVLSYYFVSADVPTGKVLFPGGYLYVKVAVPEGTVKAVLYAKLGYDYVPLDYQPHFAVESVEGTPRDHVVEFRVPVVYDVPSDFPSLPLELYVDAEDSYGAVTRSETIRDSVYATRVPYTYADGTSLWYAVTYDGSPVRDSIPSGPGRLEIWAFSYEVPGTLNVELNTDAGSYSSSLPVDDLPSSTTLSYEAYTDAYMKLSYVINDIPVTVFEGSLEVVETLYPVKLCFVRGFEKVDGVSVVISGYKMDGTPVYEENSSGEDGCALFELPPGEYRMTATHELFLPVEDNFTVISPVEKSYEMVPLVDAPDVRFKAIRKGGAEYPALSPGEYELVFEVSLRPDETATLYVTSLSDDAEVISSPVKVSSSGKTVEVSVNVSVGDVNELPYTYAAFAYRLEVNRDGRTFTVPEPDTPEGKKLTLLVLPEEPTACSRGASLFLLSRVDGTYTKRTLFSDEAGDLVVLGLSCSYDGPAEAKISVSDGTTTLFSDSVNLSLTPFEVDEGRTSLTLPEGTYAVDVTLFTPDGVSLGTYSFKLTVWGERTIVLAVSPVAVEEKTTVVARPASVPDEPSLIVPKVIGGPGVEGDLPIEFTWNGTAYTATVTPSARGGDIVLACYSDIYNCVLSPEVIFATTGEALIKYVPSAAVVPIPTGSNEVEVKVINNSAHDLRFVGHDLDCDNLDSYEVSLEFPRSLGSFDDGYLSISVTRLKDTDKNLSCVVTSTWSYEYAGEIRYVTSKYSFKTVPSEIIPGLTFNPLSITLIRGSPSEVNVVLTWESSVAPFADFDLRVLHAPDNVRVSFGEPIV